MEIETVEGEVVDESSIVAPKRPRIHITPWKKWNMVDPVWCDICNRVTWQEYQNGAYVCDHKPTNKAPYERKK